VNSNAQLKKELNKLSKIAKKESYFDISVYDLNNEDISETQLIQEMINEVM